MRYFMQHFRDRRTHSRSLTCCHNYDAKILCHPFKLQRLDKLSIYLFFDPFLTFCLIISDILHNKNDKKYGKGRALDHGNECETILRQDRLE